jgi:hypothetical protein
MTKEREETLGILEKGVMVRVRMVIRMMVKMRVEMMVKKGQGVT